MFEKCLYFNINVLTRIINSIWIDTFKPLGLSPAHAYLLRLVLENPGILQKEIVKELKLDKSTITRFINTLETENYLYKSQASTKNLKEQAIYPTDKAKILHEKLNKQSAILYKRMLDELGEEKVKELVVTLRQIAKKLR